MGRLLVTGASGFVGRHVLKCLACGGSGHDVWACGLEDHPPDLPTEHYRCVDLADSAAATKLVAEAQPDGVIHLAGAVGRGSLDEMMTANVTATENLYLALAELDDVRIVQASTAAVYGRPQSLPISEDAPLQPLSDYARSKTAQEALAVSLGTSRGVKVIRARIFNILGPGQGDHLVPMTFLKQLRETGSLHVGDISTRRDFVDVRDVAAALTTLLDAGTAGQAYNVAGGSDIAISDLLTELTRLAGLDVIPQVAPARLRTTDVPVVRADISRITRETLWRPTITWRQSLTDMWAASRK